MSTPLPSEARLIEAARLAFSKAYAPYSNFRVGAALLDAEGEIHVGCNVENASFGGTVCAERNAVAGAVVAGRRALVACAVYTDSPESTAPCGFCRQVLAEFAPDLPIVCVTVSGKTWRTTLSDLLPHSFGPDDLG